MQASSTAISTIHNANLVFNLATNGLSNNVLNLGSTDVNLGSTTLTLNLQGGNIVATGTQYDLINDAGGFSGLTTKMVDGQDVITGGVSIANSTFFGTPNANGYTTGFYNGSYLFLTDGGDQIDVEVVPEPGTWAMMLGGLALLVFIQRRRFKM